MYSLFTHFPKDWLNGRALEGMRQGANTKRVGGEGKGSTQDGGTTDTNKWDLLANLPLDLTISNESVIEDQCQSITRFDEYCFQSHVADPCRHPTDRGFIRIGGNSEETPAAYPFSTARLPTASSSTVGDLDLENMPPGKRPRANSRRDEAHGRMQISKNISGFELPLVDDANTALTIQAPRRPECRRRNPKPDSR